MYIKDSIKQKKLYIKLIFGFTLISIIIVLFTSSILSSIYIQSLNAELMKQNTNELIRLQTEFDKQISQINLVQSYINQNLDAYLYLNSTSEDLITANNAYRYLNSIKQMNPYLYSIILYNKNLSYTICSGTPDIDIKQFTNDKLIKPNTQSNYTMFFGAQISISTISFVFPPISAANSSGLDNAIILTLDPDVFCRTFPGNSTTFISDDSGNIVFDKENRFPKKNITDEAFFKKIMFQNMPSNSLMISINKEKQIVTYSRSSETGLLLINIKTTANIEKVIHRKKFTVILISIGLIILFSILGVFLSRNIYSPLQKVLNTFTQSRFGDKNKKMNEIAVITNVFKDTLDYMENLELKNVGRTNLLKEEFLRHLLSKDSISDLYQNIQGDYTFNIVFLNVIPVCIKIDSYSTINKNQRYAFESAMLSSVPGFLNDKFYCEMVNMFTGDIALLINFKSNEESNLCLLISELEKIKEVIQKSLNLSLTVGIGDLCNSMEECNNGYRKAAEMANYRFVLGLGRIIYPDVLGKNLSSGLEYPMEIENRLIASIQANSGNQFLENVEDYINYLKNCHYIEAMNYLLQSITECVKTINQVIRADSKKYSLRVVNFNTIFSNLLTLDDAKAWLLSLYEEYEHILNEMSNLKSNKYYEIIKKVQIYIQDHYSDSLMCADTLSELTAYTPYYFTRIFKEITGLNVNDYIKQVRINKAKELLSMEDYKISEIPTMLGFTNFSYFCSVFKKDVGLTPSAYRDYIFSRQK